MTGGASPARLGDGGASMIAPVASIEALVAAAQAGDEGAYTALYEHYAPAIRQCLWRRYHDSQDAEDALQDTFTKVWLALPAFQMQGGGSFQGWLYRIATNLFLDEARHRRLVQWLPIDRYVGAGASPYEAVVRPDDQRTVLAVTQAHRAEDPEAACLERELQAQVRAVLDSLPPHYAEVIRLVQFDGLSLQEAAARLGETVSAVKSRQHRAWACFRAAWSRAEAAAGEEVGDG